MDNPAGRASPAPHAPAIPPCRIKYIFSNINYENAITGEGEDGLTERKPGAPPADEIVRVKLPQKRNREMFGIAELMMGANHIRVRGFDGVTRMGRIKGKIKKKVWIREGDILIIIPWTFQDEKCDIIYRYTGPQVEWLRRNKYL